MCRCGCYCRFKLIVVVLFYWVLRFCGCGGRSSYIYPVIFKRVGSGVLLILYRWCTFTHINACSHKDTRLYMCINTRIHG